MDDWQKRINRVLSAAASTVVVALAACGAPLGDPHGEALQGAYADCGSPDPVRAHYDDQVVDSYVLFITVENPSDVTSMRCILDELEAPHEVYDPSMDDQVVDDRYIYTWGAGDGYLLLSIGVKYA